MPKHRGLANIAATMTLVPSGLGRGAGLARGLQEARQIAVDQPESVPLTKIALADKPPTNTGNWSVAGNAVRRKIVPHPPPVPGMICEVTFLLPRRRTAQSHILRDTYTLSMFNAILADSFSDWLPANT